MLYKGTWIALAIGCLAATGLGAEEKDKVPAVRELELKRFRTAGRPGRFGKPTVITSVEELAKAVPDKEAREQIQKQVDFARQQVLLFAWAGSGRDRLSAREAGGKVIVNYQAGLTRDLRPHLHFFAVRKGVKYELPDRGKGAYRSIGPSR